jgi:phosphonate transport system ATP-binding protein
VVHNPALLPLLADRVIGLRQGRIAFDLPVALARLYRPQSGTAPAAGQGLSTLAAAGR